MKKNLKYVGYRHPRTRNEMRANQEGWERPRRRPHLLPDTYDDLYPNADRKSWKAKRKTQYHPGGRGKHHQIRIEEDHYYRCRWSKIWVLERYFKDHKIPYRIETKRRFRWREYHSVIEVGFETVTVGKFSYRKSIFKRVPTGEYYRSYYIDHYIVHWWYNKDIGFDYIINSK